MNAAEHQDTGHTVTRRRHVIVTSKRPAGLNAAPVTSAASIASTAAETITPAAIGDTRVMRSEQLFAGQNALAIRHNGATYTLRVTRFGKLILTK